MQVFKGKICILLDYSFKTIIRSTDNSMSDPFSNSPIQICSKIEIY